jgi:hypothetical protein
LKKIPYLSFGFVVNEKGEVLGRDVLAKVLLKGGRKNKFKKYSIIVAKTSQQNINIQFYL